MKEVKPILEKNNSLKSINLGATNGFKNIINSKNVFKFLYLECGRSDENFNNKQRATKKVKIDIYNGSRVADFTTMFNFLNNDKAKICFTQHQILNFCRKNKKRLINWSTFFLFENEDKFFVAGISKNSYYKGLSIIIYDFNYGYSFGNEESYRVATPTT